MRINTKHHMIERQTSPSRHTVTRHTHTHTHAILYSSTLTTKYILHTTNTQTTDVVDSSTAVALILIMKMNCLDSVHGIYSCCCCWTLCGGDPVMRRRVYSIVQKQHHVSRTSVNLYERGNLNFPLFPPCFRFLLYEYSSTCMH